MSELTGSEAGHETRRPPALAALKQRMLGSQAPIELLATCLIALSAGLLFGALEVLVKVVKYRLDHVFFEWSNPDAFWMIPTAEAVLFLIVALGLYGLAALLRGRLSLKPLLVILCTLGTLSLLLSLKRTGIHDVAKLLLALGIGYQLAGFVVRRSRIAARGALVSSAIILTAALAAFIWLHGVRPASENARLAKLPAASRSLPNVLLIVLDTVRAMSLDLYGYSRQTMPRVARFAQSGVVFDQAYSVAPWTLPSHASLFTGRWYTELSADWLQPLDARFPTLAEVLADQGYATGGFVANLLFTTRITGLDRGFNAYRDHQIDAATWVQSAEIVNRVAKLTRRIVPGGPALFGRKYAADVNREFIDWLDGTGDRPFFAFLNYFDAHEPYERFDPYLAGFPDRDAVRTLPASARQRRTLNASEMDAIDRYDSSLAYMDVALGALLDTLAARGKLENTLVIITSDHGEQFYEHDLTGHSNSLYRPVLNVPLIMVLPGKTPAARRVSDAVSLRDVPSTVLELVGVRAPATFAGASLRRTWSAPGNASTPILSETNPYRLDDFHGPIERGPMKSVVFDRFHYIRNGDGSEELYDFRSDPDELVNLARSRRQREILPQARRALDSIRRSGEFEPETWLSVPLGQPR